MVRKRKFGERMGAIPAPNLGLDEIATDLQTRVWNLCHHWLFPLSSNDHEIYMEEMRALYEEMGWPAHEIPWQASSGRNWVADQILDPDIQWYRFYQFAECIPRLRAVTLASPSHQQEAHDQMRSALNSALEQEGSPYRMAVDELVPITNEEELAEVRDAVATHERFTMAGEHMAAALAHLAQRPQPNYHDAIKQAFSAVESVLWIATGDKPKMPETIRRFDERFGPIHAAMRQMIEKLHGYASDEEGVRHAATERTDVGEAEARLMVVSCSGMVNFLIRKALSF